MRLIIGILVVLFVITACDKNSLTTKPQIKVKSTNTEDVTSTNQILRFNLDISDKEADFLPYFAYQKKIFTCAFGHFTDSGKFQIPQDFIKSKSTEGQIVIDMDLLARGDNQCARPGSSTLTKDDTLVYRFWIKDAAGNVSDTAESNTIIIRGH